MSIIVYSGHRKFLSEEIMTDQNVVEKIDHTSLNLHQKIIKIMEKVTYVHKGADVSTGQNSKSYKAVQHDDVTGLLHGPAADWGITIAPEITNVRIREVKKESSYNGKIEVKISYRADVWVETTFTNSNDPKDFFIKKSFAYALDSGDKAVGKAFSMAVKYTYLKVFMLESGDNEEARDFERESTYNPNRNNNQNRSGNHAGNNQGNRNEQRNNTSNANGANRNVSGSNQTGTQKNNQESPGKISPASEAQIKAIASICSKKGIEVGEKFKTKESCSSQEASNEISRINALANKVNQ